MKTRAVWLENRLNERDFAILETIARLEIVSGIQIERLHFADLRRGATVRRRVLARLTELRALNASSRVIGGTRGGATPYIYRLDPAAALLLRLRDGHSGAQPARPKGDVPLRVVSHALAVSELYVALVELARASGGYRISDYRAEPAAWWAELRPDAYAELAGSRFRDHWWIEVDRDTESTSLLRRRFSGYAAFAEAGLAGPGGVLPRVLVTVPTIRRRAALRRALRAIPDRHRHRFHVECFDDAAAFLAAQVDTASDPIDPTE